MSNPTLRLTREEQRELLRDGLQDAINEDPSDFVEWLGRDRTELLVEIMNAMRYGAGVGPDDKFYAISRAVSGYVNRYIDSRIE